MTQTGTFGLRVFTSRAQIPIPNATVTISRRAGGGKHTLLAVRVTDENGEIAPVTVAAPAAQESESPGPGTPFATLDIRIEHPEYEMETIENVQVFSGVASFLPVALLPLPEQSPPGGSSETILIPPQSL